MRQCVAASESTSPMFTCGYACASCVAYLESYRHTVSLAQLALREPLASTPEEVPAELVRAVLAVRPR